MTTPARTIAGPTEPTSLSALAGAGCSGGSQLLRRPPEGHSWGGGGTLDDTEGELIALDEIIGAARHIDFAAWRGADVVRSQACVDGAAVAGPDQRAPGANPPLHSMGGLPAPNEAVSSQAASSVAIAAAAGVPVRRLMACRTIMPIPARHGLPLRRLCGRVKRDLPLQCRDAGRPAHARLDRCVSVGFHCSGPSWASCSARGTSTEPSIAKPPLSDAPSRRSRTVGGLLAGLRGGSLAADWRSDRRPPAVREGRGPQGGRTVPECSGCRRSRMSRCQARCFGIRGCRKRTRVRRRDRDCQRCPPKV